MKKVSDKQSFRSLKIKDLSGQIFRECDFSHCDLRGADLTNSIFAKSDLSHCRFLNAKISLNCKTFEDVKLDDMSVRMFLYLITLADCSNELKCDIIKVIGDKYYNKLKGFFEETESE